MFTTGLPHTYTKVNYYCCFIRETHGTYSGVADDRAVFIRSLIRIRNISGRSNNIDIFILPSLNIERIFRYIYIFKTCGNSCPSYYIFQRTGDKVISFGFAPLTIVPLAIARDKRDRQAQFAYMQIGKLEILTAYYRVD